ncbi:MAG: YicC/YloC family endoribonuclease [Chlamydiales bacterium]
MTAYGRGMSQFAYGRFIVEIQSVNRRFLEINVGLPRFFIRFEMEIRKWVAKQIGRGSVHVSLLWKGDPKHPVSITPNLSLAKSLKEAWELLAKELQLAPAIDLKLLLGEKDLLIYEEEMREEDVYRQALEASLNEALNHLVAMKQAEGKSLAQDLQHRVEAIEMLLKEIEEHAGDAAEKYGRKLRKRLEGFLSLSEEDEERLLREIVLFAERADITEEIVRFKSHLQQFSHLIEKPLESENESRGKIFEFLIQELNREINTIASKAAEKMISERVITIKSELEKMREQVQNIE